MFSVLDEAFEEEAVKSSDCYAIGFGATATGEYSICHPTSFHLQNAYAAMKNYVMS